MGTFCTAAASLSCGRFCIITFNHGNAQMTGGVASTDVRTALRVMLATAINTLHRLIERQKLLCFYNILVSTALLPYVMADGSASAAHHAVTMQQARGSPPAIGALQLCEQPERAGGLQRLCALSLGHLGQAPEVQLGSVSPPADMPSSHCPAPQHLFRSFWMSRQRLLLRETSPCLEQYPPDKLSHGVSQIRANVQRSPNGIENSGCDFQR